MNANNRRHSEWPLEDSIVQKFEEMANSSPRGVEGTDTYNRVQRLTKYFFHEVVNYTLIFMSHDRRMRFKPDDLSRALEQFAKASARLQQIGQHVLRDASEDDEDIEWTPGCDGDDGGNDERDDEDDEGEDEDCEGEDDVRDLLATPTFDALFPPVDESKKCIPTSVIKRMWIESMKEDLEVRKQNLFYATLERALNAYVKTMLLEPRRLDAAFKSE